MGSIGRSKAGLIAADRGNNGDNMEKANSEWVRCPVCGNKTRTMIREDTIMAQLSRQRPANGGFSVRPPVPLSSDFSLCGTLPYQYPALFSISLISLFEVITPFAMKSLLKKSLL